LGIFLKVLILGGCGYIGSALVGHLESKGMEVDSVDLELFGNPTGRNNLKCNYQDLKGDFFEPYVCTVLLAAHSSVPMAKANELEALTNNVTGFYELLGNLGPKRLIYASSSSVYSGTGRSAVDETWNLFKPHNVYDLTKFAGDALASFSNVKYYGLRFGTVCGPSPNLRTELMINSMTLNALEKGIINVQNPSVHRPILGMGDLCRSIETIIQKERAPVGIYNLASFNTTVNAIAKAVKAVVPAEIKMGPDTPTYDFSMSTKKFEEEFDFSFVETPESIVEGLLRQNSASGLRVREPNGLQITRSLPRL
jgi:UDP-glucose 4-epimerase